MGGWGVRAGVGGWGVRVGVGGWGGEGNEGPVFRGDRGSVSQDEKGSGEDGNDSFTAVCMYFTRLNFTLQGG